MTVPEITVRDVKDEMPDYDYHATALTADSQIILEEERTDKENLPQFSSENCVTPPSKPSLQARNSSKKVRKTTAKKQAKSRKVRFSGHKGEIVKILSYTVRHGFISYVVRRHGIKARKIVRESEFKTEREYRLLLDYKTRVTGQKFDGAEVECPVEKIIGHQRYSLYGPRKFSVRWLGWSHPLWNSELEEHELDRSEDLLKAYKKRHRLR